MIEISPNWITDNQMHNPEKSGFLALATGRISAFRLWAEPIEENGEVISTAIFQEYPDDAAHWGSFLHHRKRYLFRCHGHIGLYTKPNRRREGLAQRALEQMLQELLAREIPGVVNLLAAQCNIHPRFSSVPWPTWAIMRAKIGRNFWEDQLRREMTHRRKTPPAVRDKEAAATLLAKGYKTIEVAGKKKIHSEYDHPEHGTLRRTETIRLRSLL